ncbi:MAG: carboxypeptidase-like regulatory domain-containing protein [Marinilabiliaceae bacterium]
MRVVHLYTKPIALLFLLLLTMGCEDTIDSGLTGTLTGRVLEQETMMPLEGVRISTNPYSDVTETDSSGYFILEDVKEGEYNVIASKSDYKSESLTINVFFEEETDVEMVMSKSVKADDSLEFTGTFAPEDQELLEGLEVTFSWQMNTTDSVSFDLIMFEPGVPDSKTVYENLPDTFQTVSGLRFNSSYYWQVRAKAPFGDVYSETRSFYTPSLPSNQILFSQETEEVLQLFTGDSLMEAPVQVTHDKHHTWNARVSPGKTAIAFQSSRDVESRLYTMNMDGGNAQRVTSFQIGGYYHQKIEYDWAPNGASLVFTSYDNLYRINPDGSGLELIAKAPGGKHFREMAYDPNGDAIYAIVLGNVATDRQIYQMDSNGDDLELLYEDPGYALAHLDVSPDGNKLLFSKDVSGYVSTTGRMLDARIFELTISNGETRGFSDKKESGTNDVQGVYAPHGGQIVFVNKRNTLSAPPNLWIMDIDGNRREKIRAGGSLPHWFE